MKAMGIDFGLARMGIALSDETKFLASPYMILKRKGDQTDIDILLDIIKKEKVDEIVCGLPYNMQGEEQNIAEKTRAFMDKLAEQSGIDIHFVDERLSSVMAEEILKKTERDWKKRKEKLDSVAASIILQDYLDVRR